MIKLILMKNAIPFLIALFLFSSTGFSQEKKGDRIKTMKTAFITQELNLTQKEAEKFWPVYNSYDTKIAQLRKENRSKVKGAFQDGINSLSEVEASQLLNHIKEYREKEHLLETKLESELLNQLSAKKVLMLKKAEYEFKMQLLKKYRGEKK